MALDPTTDLDAEAICRVLDRHGVDCIVIGGVGAILQGVPGVTQDLDIVPEPAADNLSRLTAALREMKAEVAHVGPVQPHPDGDWLGAAKTWNFLTEHGRFDVLFAPAGTEGFADLARRAERMPLDATLTVVVASVEDLIRMKEAAGRAKDELTLPFLRWLRDRPADAS